MALWKGNWKPRSRRLARVAELLKLAAPNTVQMPEGETLQMSRHRSVARLRRNRPGLDAE